MTDNVRRSHARLRARFTNFYFDDSVGQSFVSYDDLEWRADQIGIIEFHTRSFFSIIPEHLEAGGQEILIETDGRLSGLVGLADR